MICMDLLKDMIGKAATPATNHLFRVAINSFMCNNDNYVDYH
jgi:hypothetical protein